VSDAVLILLLAAALDLLWGEPPSALHPVVWMGRWLQWGERHAPNARPFTMFVYGLLIVLIGLVVVVLLAWGVNALLAMTHRVVYLVGSAWLLKTTFAIKALAQAAHAVQGALQAGNLIEARRLLSWHLVSRDTTNLDESLVAAATIESVAENFGDGIVAPLFYFALCGLPGALAYRFVNTADALWGYRDARREYLGKFAARLDDALNLVPARLAALLLVLSAVLTQSDAKQAWRVLWRDHARTASPNAGWPMSAMAGALDATLSKVGHYTLGDGAAPLNADTIARSLRIMGAACLVWLLGLVLIVR
jgi:adenosylcobinamide-phosphate synthase